MISISTALPHIFPRDRCSWTEPQNRDVIYSCTPRIQSQDIPSAKLSIYAFDDFPPPPDSTYLNDAIEAATVSMAVYQEFLNGESLDIEIFVVSAMTNPGAGTDAVTHFAPSSNTCYIQITTQEPTNPTAMRDPIAFKQTLAHEVYHCIQGRLGQRAADQNQHSIANWWGEGTAVYFGNTIYPYGPKGWLTQYVPKTPLYAAGVSPTGGDGNSAALFFQHLSSNLAWSNRDIHDFMANQKFVNSIEEERVRVSSDTNLAAAFQTFATRFLDNLIYDGVGSAIQSEYVGDVYYEEFILPSNAGVSDFHIDVTPWNIETAKKTTLQSDQIVTVTFSANDEEDDRTVVQYRKLGEIEWKYLSKGDTVTIHNGEDETECQARIDDLIFLLTTTYDPALGERSDTLAHVKLTFTVTEPKTKRDDKCEDKCLVGNWSLDIPSMQAFLAEAMSKAGGGATITNLGVSGVSSFTVADDLSSTMSFSHLIIGYDATVSGFSFHTDIDIDGSVIGNLVDVTSDSNSTSSSFTWVDSVSTGVVKTSTEVAGFGDPIPFDIPLDGQYGSETTVEYACAGDTLRMTGYVKGKYVWGYSWARA